MTSRQGCLLPSRRAGLTVAGITGQPCRQRLLTEDSVDQRMLEILRVKADEFNEYARRSDQEGR